MREPIQRICQTMEMNDFKIRLQELISVRIRGKRRGTETSTVAAI